MHALNRVAGPFVDIAHRIVWCVAATTDTQKRPTTRVLHPLWEWNGSDLVGWIATSPLSPKARHLNQVPKLSVTYWDATQDTCTAECDIRWDDTPELRLAAWDRFKNAPAPVGYDPAIVPGWEHPQTPGFGVIRLTPTRLRVMAGAVMLKGEGEVLTWRRS